MKRYNATINIDHHVSNDSFADYNYVKNVAATGELIYELTLKLGVNITKEIATNLYIAISTDTGGFNYSNTTSETLYIASQLLKSGIEHGKINKFLYMTNSYSKTMLIKEALSNLEIYGVGEIAIVHLSNAQLFSQYNSPYDNTEGIVQYPRNIAGVRAGVLIKEPKKGFFKVSMRSDGSLDLSKIAQKFGGGGHICAAGFRTPEQSNFHVVKYNLVRELVSNLDRFKQIVESGILNVYKPIGITSHDVVDRVRKILSTKKIGHTGTLDVTAAGVLPICVNKATKVASQLMNRDKEYKVKFKLGSATDTQDYSGKIINVSDKKVTDQEILDAINSFIGKIQQIPPEYSAVKVNGKKLYQYAREGTKIEVKPREVTVYGINDIKIEKDIVTMTVKVSKGTYIRTLCHDIGLKLGCYAHVVELIRTKSGNLNIENSLTLEKLEEIVNQDKLNQYLIPIEDFFDYTKIYLSLSNQIDLINGKIIQISGLEVGKNYRIYSTEGFLIALGTQTEDSLKSEIPFF